MDLLSDILILLRLMKSNGDVPSRNILHKIYDKVTILCQWVDIITSIFSPLDIKKDIFP